MSNFFVRSRPTANWSTGAKTLGQKVVATSTTAFLGILFEVTTAGTSSGSEPAWNATVGGTTTDSGGVVWTTRGGAGIWLASKAYALGDRVCKVSQATLTNASSCVWKCTTAGTSNTAEPTWPTTIASGTTTQTDNTVTWTAEACTDWDDANPFIVPLLHDTTNTTVKVSAGDTVYVSKYHSEATTPGGFATQAITGPGTVNNPCRMICVDDTGQLTAGSLSVATGALFHLNSATAQTFAINGYWYGYGCTMSQDCTNGTTSVGLGGGALVLDNWGLTIPSAATSTAIILLGATASGLCRVKLNNCTLNLSDTNAIITVGDGQIELYGGSLAGSGVGTSTAGYIQPSAYYSGSALFDGFDFSAVGAHKVMSSNYYASSIKWTFTRCKFASGGSVLASASATSIGWGTGSVDEIGCDYGAGTNYKIHREHGCGTIDQDIVRVRSGGASDGTTPIAWKAVSNANAAWHAPLEVFPIATWNDNSGTSKTATVEILTDSLTALNNDDIWLELEYLADSGDTLAGIANDTKSNVLASNAAQPTSTASWTTTGITNVMTQKLQVTFTPQQKGAVTAKVYIGKASATVYIDPVLSIA